MATEYIYYVQGNYGTGWEDLTAADTWREAQQDLRAYRLNTPEVPTRVVKRGKPKRGNE